MCWGPGLAVVITTRSMEQGVAGKPVFLRDIATIRDGPPETTNLSRISFGASALGLTDERRGLRGAYIGNEPSWQGASTTR